MGRAHRRQRGAMDADQQERAKRGLSRRLLAAFFIGAGVNHFVMPRAYEADRAAAACRAMPSASCRSAAWPRSWAGVGVLRAGDAAPCGASAWWPCWRRCSRRTCTWRARPSASQDPPLGAVRAPAAAAADDAVGVAGDAPMTASSRAGAATLLCSVEEGCIRTAMSTVDRRQDCRLRAGGPSR